MLTIREAKQILLKGWLLLALVISAGCLPDQSGSVETVVPTAVIGETAESTTEGFPVTPTITTAATSTPIPQDTQPQPEPIRIELESGAASEAIAGPLDGQNQVHYVFWAEARQTMMITVTSPNNGVLFHLQGINDGQVYKHLLDGESEWQGVVPQAQDYLLMLDAVGGPTTYTAFISIADQSVTATPTPAGEAIPGGPLYPVVDAESGYLLGGTQNGQWIDGLTYAAYLQDTERPYSLYTLAGAQGIVTGNLPITPGHVCSQPVVSFNPSQNLAGAIALVTTWEAAPRLAQSLPVDTAVYREAIATLLQENGLSEPEVQINSIQRIDLEGDGVDEVLITASRLVAGTSLPPVAAGDYSVVVLRKVTGDTVVAIPLAIDVYPQADDLAYPFQYRLLGLLDLDGDGRLEVIVAADQYEGYMVMVYQVTSSSLQVVLQAGCGH